MTPARQDGLTMVELMVAITVGLLVLLFAAAMLVSANRGHAAQEEAARLDDSGRFALETIARAVRQTAYVNWDRADAGIAADPAAPARVAGMDNRSLVKTAEFISDPRPDVANGSDVLALRFAGAGPGKDGDGSMTSCAGFGVSEMEEGWSIFFVGRSALGDTELRCKYRGATSWGADAIVGGVDSFQVLYGLDTDVPADGLANLYVNAGVVALCPVITTAPASLPNGTVGVAYSQQITTSGGVAPFTFTLVSGALPGGLALGPSGLLAGVPAAGTEGTYTFRVRATDTSGCTSDRDYVLIIAAAVPVLPPGLLLVMALLLLAAGALVMRRRGVA
jgi:prepilin-type N-terminal cleavage/methylation domain-containing protein